MRKGQACDPWLPPPPEIHTELLEVVEQVTSDG